MIDLGAYMASLSPATVTLHIEWKMSTPPKIPATSYRLEENINGAWGNIAGVTSPTIIIPPIRTFDVPLVPVGTTRTYRVIPIANNLDGQPSNIVIAISLIPSDERDVLTVTPINLQTAKPA